MTKRQSWPSFARGFIRQLRRDTYRSLSRLVKLRHDRRGRLIIDLTWPSFRSSRWYFRRRFNRRWHFNQLSSSLLSLSLISLSILGIVYLTEPFRGQPVFYRANVPTTSLVTETVKATVKPVGLKRSIPVSLGIPALKISSKLIKLGKNADGSLATPNQPGLAGWYKYSPTPGQVGPAVIVGHVDSESGPAVFYNLHKIKAGQKVTISRKDGSRPTFVVYKVASYSQDDFPTKTVYGDTSKSELRLITCGGPFNYLTGHYTENTVVFASLKG